MKTIDGDIILRVEKGGYWLFFRDGEQRFYLGKLGKRIWMHELMVLIREAEEKVK